MNKDTVVGKVEQLKGEIKQKAGEAFNNDSLANSGAVDQVKGAAREAWGKTKDTVHDVASSKQNEASMHADDTKAHVEAKAHELREKVTNTAQNVKEKISEKLDDFKDRHSSHNS
jgi:uncharacterized protein YjbJ (UPF0337 family)